MNKDDQAQQLFEHTRRMCSEPFYREVIWQHSPFLEGASPPPAFDLTIHPGDQMLWHSLKHHGDANASFSQYYNVALQQYNAMQQILRLVFGDRFDNLKILDFACGYGRLLRFLSQSHPLDNICASEIQADAMRFVAERFGIQSIPSYADPQRFQPPQSFDVIWVASLFSHLPPGLFEQWLARLHQCLTPKGVLCFSAHDACLLPDDIAMPDSGIHYRPFSENPDLDGASYGTTFVTEDYVRRSIAAACGPECRVHRIPRGLANEQDLYVVSGTDHRDLGTLQGFRYGAWGWVDERVMRPDGTLYLRGWAASLDDGPLDTVRIGIDGKPHECPTGLPRADVAQVFDDNRLTHCGWEFTCKPGKPVRISVTAQTNRGERALLLTGEYRPTDASIPPPEQGDDEENHASLWKRLKGLLSKT